MKKIISLSAIVTGIIFLAAGISGAAPDDSAVAKENSNKQCCSASKSCCAGGQAGKCESDAKVVVQETQTTCKHCSEKDCKTECKECAELGNDTAVAKADSTDGKQTTAGLAAGHSHAGDSQHDIDHQDFFFLIDHKESIQRTVKNLPNGIETTTESPDKAVAERIQKHVEAMYARVENVNPIRMRDPLFREIFANAKKIKMQVKHTDQGVLVTETSDDPYVAKLLQEHAKVVSKFIKNGYAELPKNHAAPKR
ncbi:MAG: hypothetical protein KDB00_12065 [Planctomycetales bacterium]|nr:hypothetical protein [Planctomycetales bacterium]